MQVYDLPFTYDDRGIDIEHWQRTPGNANDTGVNVSVPFELPGVAVGRLIAWDPVKQKEAWRVAMPSFWNGGTMATAGNLVFHGRSDGFFDAYDAFNGKRLWSFDAGAAVIAPPITYRAHGRQYVTVPLWIRRDGRVVRPTRGEAGLGLTHPIAARADLYARCKGEAAAEHAARPAEAGRRP